MKSFGTVAAGLFLAATALLGCGALPTGGESPTSTEGAISTRASTADPTEGPNFTSPHMLTQQVVNLEWRELRTLERRTEASADAVFDGRYLIDPARSASDESLVVVDTQDGHVVVDHRILGFDAGWRTLSAWLLAPWVLFTEENVNDSGGQPIRTYRYDIRSGGGIEVTALSEFPAAWLVWDEAGGIAVFDTRDPERLTSCLWTLDVAALTWSERWCGPMGWIIAWPRLGPGSSVTLQLQEDPKDGLEPCARLLRLSLVGTDDPVELPLQAECHAFSGAGGSDWTAWSEVGLHDENIGDAQGFSQFPDGQLASLGYVATGSMMACDGWVYWQARQQVAFAPPTLVRWHPGAEAQLVFAAAAHSLMSRIQCAGGWITMMVAVPGETETIYSARTDP